MAPYKRNLRELLSHFYHEIDPMRFVLVSKGHGDNQIHGLAMCNVGISAGDCSIRIANATENICQRCPYGKIGLSCHDDCLLRYSNSNFFGKVENKTATLDNWRSVHRPSSFNMKRLDLLRNIPLKHSKHQRCMPQKS
ncbi:cysteine-rich repeat secretory protein 38-like [Ziziphus jujuba]|uniref:Cysteine-rich repeat secretory protein 38-like n=1 Tax=Ziziphus jujuba TaxID=326968 RepID=A0ABM4A7T5_ZIZJJ|nr:cysteine-rich repeat secretory protein 38-like [Ziziphus jujuba]